MRRTLSILVLVAAAFAVAPVAQQSEKLDFAAIREEPQRAATDHTDNTELHT